MNPIPVTIPKNLKSLTMRILGTATLGVYNVKCGIMTGQDTLNFFESVRGMPQIYDVWFDITLVERKSLCHYLAHLQARRQ